MRERGQVVAQYDAALADIPAKAGAVQRPKAPEGWITNHAYYPVIFRSGEAMLRVKTALEAERIFPRRYFYPSLDTLPYVKADACPVSRSIAERILCLPLYPGLAQQDVERIARLVAMSC